MGDRYQHGFRHTPPVTDHGDLTGLDDDDHGAIYYTEAEIDALLHAELTDHGALGGLDDGDHNAIYYTEAEVDALLHAQDHASRHATGGADNLSGEIVEVSKLRVDDTDGTPQGDILLRNINERLEIRNAADNAFRNIRMRMATIEDQPFFGGDVANKTYVDAQTHTKYTDDEAITAANYEIFIPFGNEPDSGVTIFPL